MARIGQNTRRKFVSTGRNNAIANACQNALENLEDRRLLSTVVETGAGLSSHQRHIAHVHHLGHLKQLALSGAAPAAAAAATPAPLPAGTPSVIQAAADGNNKQYIAYNAVQGIVTDPDSDGHSWQVISGSPAADGGFTFPSAGAGAPVLKADNTGTVTYNIHFNAPGDYKLYVRDKFLANDGSNGDNSMLVPPSGGLTSAAPSAIYDNDATGADGRFDGNYSWDISAPTPPIVYHITAAGDTTISFNTREPNYFLDRIVLSTDQTLQSGQLDALSNTPVAVGSPATLTAVAAQQAVNLSWASVIGAATYNIKRATVSGGPYTTVQTGVTGTSVTDNVPANGTYFYVVSASNSLGVEGAANSPQATVNVTGQLAPPTGVVTTGSLSKVTITWTPPDGGPTGYDVKRGTSASGPFTTIGSNVAGPSFDDTTAASNTQYYYVVSALKTGVPASDNSVAVAGARAFVGTGDGWGAKYYADNITAAGTPQFQRVEPVINVNAGYAEPNGPGQIAGLGVPANFNTGFGHTAGANFSIRWEGMVTAQYNEQYTFYGASDDGIQITVDGVVIDPNLGALRGVTEDTSLVPVTWTAGSKHDVVVQFVEAGGGWGYYLKWSSPSTPKDFVPQSQVQAILPDAPTLSAVANNGSVALNWSSVAADSYTVLRGTAVGGPFTPLATNVTGTTYTDSTVTNGTTYYYQVQGVVQLGNGPVSATVPATPNPQPPQAPTGVTAVPRQNAATVSWGTVAFASTYNVLRGPVGGPYTPLAAGTGIAATTFLDKTAVLGQVYQYQVVANNVSGSSAPSVAVTADLQNGTIVHFYNDGWWKSPTQNNTGYKTASAAADGSVIYPGLNQNWGTGSPDASTPGTRTDNFATVTTGQISIDAATAVDPIMFALQSDDAGYLFVDGTLVASDPGGHGLNTAYSGADTQNGIAGTPKAIRLTAGKHNIMFYQAEQGGGAGTVLLWQPHYIVGTSTPAPVVVPANLLTTITGAPAKPSIVSANGAPGSGAIISFFDNSTSELGFILQRSTSPTFDLGTVQNIATQGIHDQINDSNITFTDSSNQLTQKLYYRVLAFNFEGSTASDVLSVDPQSFVSPGAEVHYFNNQWWKSTDQSTFAPASAGASVAGDVNSVINTDINLPAGPAAGPTTGIPGTNFSIVFTGKINIVAGGSYTFPTITDDDSYLYVDGQLVASDPGGHGLRTAPNITPITLTAGEHNFQFFHSQGGGGWGYQLQYNGPDTGGSTQIVPSSAYTNSLSSALVAPGALSFTNVSAGAVTVNWGDTNLDEIQYVVERSTDNFATNDVIVTRGINATSFTDFTVAPSTAYSYRVHAINFDYVGPSVTAPISTIAAVGTGGSITGANPTTPSAIVDLAAQGTRDWAHWGVNTANTFDHRGAATEHISDVTMLNGGAKNQFTTSPTAFSWNNGGPYNTSVTGTTTGIYTGGVGSGFEFTVPADTTSRHLLVYVGAVSAKGQLTAHLSDGSAVQFSNNTLDSLTTTPVSGVYTIDYKAASAGQALIVDWVETVDHGNGVIALAAAALGNANDFATPSYVSVKQGGYAGRITFVNNTPTATSLVLQRSTDPNFGAGTITTFTLPGNATSYNDLTAFKVGTRYYYRVQALGAGNISTAFSAAGSFLFRPVPSTIDHTTGFLPPVLDTGTANLITDGSFETPSEPGANFYYAPTGGTWAFTGTTGIISPPSAFGTPSAAVDGLQYLFVQTNTGAPQNDPVNGATVSETVNGFIAGQKYVFNVFDAARNGQAPAYKVVLDAGTPNEQLIYIGSPTSNTFTQKYSLPFTTTAGSHVLTIAAVGTTDNTAFLDQASIQPYISGSGSSDLTLNGGALITFDGRLEMVDGQNNETRSAYETTAVPLTGDFNTTFDFQFSGNAAADGITFALQSNNPNALGGGGGSMGLQGLANSFGVQFNMYNNVTETGTIIGNNSTRQAMTSLGNAFHTTVPTDIFHVTLSYDYASKTLTETVIDTGSPTPGGTGTTQFQTTYNVDIPALLGNAGPASYAYAGFTGASGGANSIQDILNWKFQSAPVAVTNDFLYQSGPRQISMKFSEDVSASLQASDLIVHNVTTNADVPAGTLTYDPATNIATWTFAAGGLTNGNYHASLASGAVNNTTNLHVSPTSLDFFWLNGDTNRDRTVGFADLVAVAQHYGQSSGGTLATGDLDGDGKVQFSDLVAVAQNYGTSLAALPSAVPAPLPSGEITSPAEQAAVLAALPNSEAKTFAIQFLASKNTTPTKPAPVTTTKPAPVTTTAKPVVATVTPVAKPAATFSTTRISSNDKKNNSLLN